MITEIVIGLLPYITAVLAVITLAVAIWSHRWPSVRGTIDVAYFDREPDQEGPPLATKGEFNIVYSYSRNGVAYQDSRIAPFWQVSWQVGYDADLSSGRTDSQWYREGNVVEVYYCPLWPRWVCLEPGGYLPTLMMAIASGVLFLATS